MAVFADLLLQANPRLLNFNLAVTEAVDWKFSLTIKDNTGSAYDFTGVTFTCKIITDVGGTDVATWTVTGNSSGVVTGTLADATTAGLAGSATRDNPRRCLWYCVAAHSGGDKVQMWGPSGSVFLIGQAS